MRPKIKAIGGPGAGAGVHLCEVFFGLRPDLGTLRPQKDLVA